MNTETHNPASTPNPKNTNHLSEWREVKLGDLCTKIGSGATPRGGSESYKEFGVSLIRSQNVLDLKFSEDGLAFIDEIQANDLKNVIVEKNDVLMNITGDSVARVCKVPTKILPARVNQHVAIIRSDENKLNYDFILYYLHNIKEYLLSISEIGATRRAITKGMIESLDILLPPLPEQTTIAEVLSSLDDKIDLLHRQNATLEKMAETLFRQWFVEEAKEEWETLPLSKMANFLNGLACQKFPPKNDIEKLPVLKIKELTSGITENSDWASTDIKPEYIVRNGDVIFAWSASLMVKIWDGQDCILNQHLFKVTSEDYPKWFYYLWCKHHLAEFISIAASHATTMGHIKRGDLDDAKVFIPSPEEMSVMNEQVEPLIDKIIANSAQIRTLTVLRDTLLPKLMSGEVRVSF
jgi:type I restriction enzyme S subunit